MITIDTLSKLIDATVAIYPDDPSQPSVTLSRLKDGMYYGSIVRYLTRFGADKKVVHVTKAETIGAVLRNLAKFLVDKEDAIKRLKDDIQEA